MYRVELSEQEVRSAGSERYAKKHWKRTVIVFIAGLVVCCVGAANYDAFLWGKVLLILAGIAWVAISIYFSKKAGKAGREFLEKVKNGADNNLNL